MKPPSDEELILHYYGESDDPESVRESIAHSPEVAARFDALRTVLDAVPRIEAPNRSELYGRRVWKNLSPQLTDSGTGRGRAPGRAPQRRRAARRSVVGLLAASLLVAVAFWVGRVTAPEAPLAAALSDLARGRILRSAVAEHLERSQFLLEEISNDGLDTSDTDSRHEIHRLLVDNRLYRQAARHAGYGTLEELLGELERYLTDLEHLEPASEAEIEGLEERLRQTDLLFKVRVTVAVLERQTGPTPPATTI